MQSGSMGFNGGLPTSAERSFSGLTGLVANAMLIGRRLQQIDVRCMLCTASLASATCLLSPHGTCSVQTKANVLQRVLRLSPLNHVTHLAGQQLGQHCHSNRP